MKLKYLSKPGSDAKTVKGEKFGWLTFIMYLAPYNVSGFQVCPFASRGCSSACLFTAGMGIFKNVQEARIKKTLDFFNDRSLFYQRLTDDIEQAVRYAKKKDMRYCFRLNGTSDINWSEFARLHPDHQFYDYTKAYNRMVENDVPNYHLTFSRSEENEEKCLKVLESGGNVAVVFDTVPKTWKGFKVVNGDESDLRFLDPKGVVVGLKAKGKALKDESGFVVKAA